MHHLIREIKIGGIRLLVITYCHVTEERGQTNFICFLTKTIYTMKKYTFLTLYVFWIFLMFRPPTRVFFSRTS